MKAAHLFLDRVPATALLLGAVLSIQLGAALAISLFPTYGPLGLLTLRMAIGAVLLCLFCRAALAGALRQAPWGVLLLGVTMVLQSGAFYQALARLPLGITVAIEFLGPLGVALATSRRPIDILWVLLAGAGIALLTPSIGGGLDPTGVLFALGAAAGWACFILAGRRLGRTVEGGVGIALSMSVSGLLLLPVAGAGALAQAAAHPATLPAVVGVALFSAAIPYLLEFLALRRMAARQYGVLVSTEPVVATIVGAVVLADAVDLRGWIAILLISLASVGVSLSCRNREGPV